MSKVKKQHFVPRFYLKHFTNSKGKISAFDIQEQNSFSTTVEKVAHKRFFYDYEPLDNIAGQQLIEKTFAQYEGDSANLFRSIVSQLEKGDLSNHTPEQRAELAEYIILQQTRTVENRIVSEQMAKELERQVIAKGAGQEFFDSTGLRASNFDSKFLQLFALLNPEIEERIRELCDRFWIFWHNTTKHNFYTSDHPVVGHIHEDRNLMAYELYFPLTPKYAVSILLKNHFEDLAGLDNQVIELDDPERVKFYNYLVLSKCNRQIFNSENDFRLAKKILKSRPELSNPDRQRVAKM
ncbi:DUF4238 domain-containing protein [Ekhidna sp. MALMAid0563]|uniref:DUF4238 domain-containing protein n=1 Tax=Ekhidna sp. MALMAid0563 TaxID=3143937 RepID=UPI0032DFB2A8